MYDWNRNGEHDAFDDAMFMTLLDEDLERHPPSKKEKFEIPPESVGCSVIAVIVLAVMLLFLVAVMYLDDEAVMLLFFWIAAMAIVIYAYKINKEESSCFTEDKLENNSNIQTKVKSSAIEVKRFGNYDVVIDNNRLILKRFVGVDKENVEVPAELDGIAVRCIDYNAFQNCKNIKRVIIADGIEEIKIGAFRGCDNLREILIPKSVKEIGENIFQLDSDSDHTKHQSIIVFCYGGSCALEYARKYNMEYRDAETFDRAMGV